MLSKATTWQTLAAVATILGAAVVVYAAIVALGQLKEMTKARHLDAMLRIYELIGSEDARRARRRLYGISSPPSETSDGDWAIVEDVSVTFDRIGLLVVAKLVPEELLFAAHCEVVMRAWEKCQPYILYRRKIVSASHVRHFEVLANLANRYFAAHYPGSTVSILNAGNIQADPQSGAKPPGCAWSAFKEVDVAVSEHDAPARPLATSRIPRRSARRGRYPDPAVVPLESPQRQCGWVPGIYPGHLGSSRRRI